MENRAQALSSSLGLPSSSSTGKQQFLACHLWGRKARGCHLSFLGTFSWPHLPTPNILAPMDLTAEAEDSLFADDSAHWV